jgi:hypothetical protein
MLLSFDKQIDLTTYSSNPDPKFVSQLSIVHEAFDGDITQYYIDPATLSEGDKATHAIGVPVKNSSGNIHYKYNDYDELKWGKPGARITRRRIDRLGVKAFPNIGAIAHYKLAYQNLSKIIAPVNYKRKKTKAPVLAAHINSDDSVTFTITPPLQDSEDGISYQCYRITLQLDLNRLEYITYDTELTIPKVLVTGKYTAYATGYVNEGEVCSDDSNEIELNLSGTFAQWPEVTPGAEAPQRLSELLDVSIGTLEEYDMLKYNAITHKWNAENLNRLVDITPALQSGTKVADTEVGTERHSLYAPTPPDGIVFRKVLYYNSDGSSLLHKEYVENGDSASWTYQDDKWSFTPGGTEDANAKNNITANRNLYYVSGSEQEG